MSPELIPTFATTDQIRISYQLPAINKVEKVTKGTVSHNYILETGDGTKYFLRRYGNQDLKIITQILYGLDWMGNRGVPAILPLVGTQGQLWEPVDDIYYSLFPAVSGLELESVPNRTIAISSLGANLAAIHLAGKLDAPIPNIEVSNWRWDTPKFKTEAEQLGSVINSRINSDESGFVPLALDAISFKVGQIEQLSFRAEDLQLHSDHLIHGDYNSGNMFFGPDSRVTHIFDWDHLHVYVRGFELLKSIFITCFDDGCDESAWAEAELYLKSYHQVYPLSKRELVDSLKLLYANRLHHLWFEKAHFQLGDWRGDQYLAPNLNIIKYLSSNLEAVSDRFLAVLD